MGEGTVAGEVTVTGALSGPSIADNAGTISPGNSPGTITAGDLILNSTDTVVIEIDGDAGAGVAGGHDVINVITGGGLGGSGLGTVDLGDATLDLTGPSSLSITAGTELVIVDNDGTEDVTGTFDGLAEGDVVLLGGQLFALSYEGGTGNDVTLTARDAGQVEFDDFITGVGLSLIHISEPTRPY